MKTVADVLKAARAKIEKPENWGKGAWARNLYGEMVLPASNTACQWCAAGALRGGQDKPSFALSAEDIRLRSYAEDALENAKPGGQKLFNCVPEFNDHPATTHADVLALFDRAIAAEEAKIGGAV